MRQGWLAFELFPKGKGLKGEQLDVANQVKDFFKPQIHVNLRKQSNAIIILVFKVFYINDLLVKNIFLFSKDILVFAFTTWNLELGTWNFFKQSLSGKIVVMVPGIFQLRSVTLFWALFCSAFLRISLQ